ncbi:hypothetical protein [Haloferula sp.]|uniref:hypothetical protein n=1 Tax=Haloferula sp. TaxID=2497595 RepID=UPI003C739DFD
MKTSRYLFAALALVILGVAAWLQSQEKFEPILVAAEGNHPIDHSADIHVFTDDNDLLNISYSIDGSKQQWTRGFIDPKSDWFLYVYRRNEIWLVDDQDVILILDFDGASGNYGLFNCHDSKVLNEFIYDRAPSHFIKMLPKGVAERIEEAKRSGHTLETDGSFVAAAPKI